MSKSKKPDEDILKLVVAHLERIETKVDKLDDRLDASEKIQIKQEANIAEHIRRTDLLETAQGDLKKSVRPLLKAYTVFWGICRIMVGIGVMAGIVLTVFKILGK